MFNMLHGSCGKNFPMVPCYDLDFGPIQGQISKILWICYSFIHWIHWISLLFPRNSVEGDIVTRPFVGGWVSGWVRACVCVSVTLYLVGMIATTVFAQSLSLQFLPNHFQTSHVGCGWWEEEPCWFWVTGSKVKVNSGTLCIRPCGHDSDYSFCPITFKLHM